MITCFFEDQGKALLRHVTFTGIAEKNGKILIEKRATNLTQGNKFALPGGFLSRDESVKEGIVREVKEETGYESTIKDLFRINDNPNRANEDRQNVDFTYIITIGEKTSLPDSEVQEVFWFDLNNLPPEEYFAFDHYEIIMLYKKYLQEKFPLPIIG